MQFTKIRLAIAGIIAAGLLIGGTAAVMRRTTTNSVTNSVAAAPVAAPPASVPGYVGPLYDAQGKLVGYATPPEAVPPPANAVAGGRYTAAPAPRQAARAHGRPRSTRKSAAIVAGSAGFGAAIGALAGGGTGAAIGALSGGGAGYVYDRLTHNR